MTINIERYKSTALKILSPIKQIDNNTIAKKDFLFSAKRSKFSSLLPSYYLIYFLFNDLLNFKDLGKFEKLAWSFPIDYDGKAFLIEYRKFGVGVFIQEETDEINAEKIVKKICGAVKSARPFYNYLAEEAVKSSKLNIINNNQELFERFTYLNKLYKNEIKKYEKNKNNVKTITKEGEFFKSITTKNIGNKYKQNANKLAISSIEAFYSWTEHLFVHLAVIAGNVESGEEISNLIAGEWKIKYKAAITDNSVESNKYLSELLTVRQQLRNFVAHGAFGKDGNAYLFHSGTGAVPVIMSFEKNKSKYSFYGSLNFNEEDVIKLIEEFINFLNSGYLKPSMLYTQEYGFPTIVPYASAGIYESVNSNMKLMRKFCEDLGRKFDDAANMDW